MTSGLVFGAALALMVVILASILGAIDRPERYLFVAGIALFILAHTAITGPASAGMVLATLGILLAVASTVPLLRQSV
jgi:uncharacterized membrane protein YhhN